MFFPVSSVKVLISRKSVEILSGTFDAKLDFTKDLDNPFGAHDAKLVFTKNWCKSFLVLIMLKLISRKSGFSTVKLLMLAEGDFS